MGRSYTPKYRVWARTYRIADGSRRMDRIGVAASEITPSDEGLADYVRSMDASTEPGGVNAHLGQQMTTSARLIDQSTGATVASFDRPAFEVIAEGERA
jgi:hypothetical protein